MATEPKAEKGEPPVADRQPEGAAEVAPAKRVPKYAFEHPSVGYALPRPPTWSEVRTELPGRAGLLPAAVEWAAVKLLDLYRRWASVRVLLSLGVVFSAVLGYYQFQEGQRQFRAGQRVAAWNVVAQVSQGRGNIGLRDALELLHGQGESLKNVRLSRANLIEANLGGANLGGANLSGARDLTCKQLQAAHYWEQTLRDTSLKCGALPESPRGERQNEN